MTRITGRINGFDALRAAAMWLGVLLHSLIVYKATPEANWPSDNSRYVLLDWLYEFIHIFRMPLFYLVSGFFAHLVITKYGILFFAKQRFKRIFIPFIIGLIVIVPVSLLPFHFHRFYFIEQNSINDAFAFSIRQMFRWNGMAHLWFLYYLIFFYVLSYLIAELSNKAKKWKFQVVGKTEAGFRIVLTLSFILFFSLLYFSNYITPPVYTGIKPNLPYILYYGFFYFSGWIIYVFFQAHGMLLRSGVFLMVAGIAISITRFLFLENQSYFLNTLLAAIETFFLVYGILGVFLKLFNNESRFWRYLSDSSYWVYLIHVSIVGSAQVLLLSANLHGVFKLLIVLLITIFITLITYRYFVRYTIIGEVLNGKREKQTR